MKFNKKIAFGAWINDIKNIPMANSNWPDVNIDDQTIKDYANLFKLLKESGYDSIDIFGLLVGHDWPPELETVLKNGRKEKVTEIIDLAHKNEIDVIFGLGIYSWGFDAIIRSDPEIQGTNKSAMCGSKEKSKKWQERVIKLIIDNFDIDGFHLEASDQGRCLCPECSKEGNVQYYSRLNKEAAIFIRERCTEKYLLVNDCAYLPWGDYISKDEFKYVYDLGKHIDAFIDNGNHGLFIREEDRKEFIKDLPCGFGSSGGFWIYAPQRWDRLRWFLPYVNKTGNFLKSLYSDGGRACEYYMGPTVNPGTEVNIYFGGLLLSNIDKEIGEILRLTLDKLYVPKNSEYLGIITEIFIDAENAFFDNWKPSIKPFELPEKFAGDVETLRFWSEKTPERTIPGELFLEPLVGLKPGEPIYLKNNMSEEGLRRYKTELEKISERVNKIKTGFDDSGRISRISECISNTIKDINQILS